MKPEGIRIRHKSLKSVMLVIRDQSRPLKQTNGKPLPQNFVIDPCRTCGTPHDVKTYHLDLDGEGTIIVSTTVYEKLQALADHGGFEFVNRVVNPPAQELKIPLVLQKAKAFDPIRKEHIHGGS